MHLNHGNLNVNSPERLHMVGLVDLCVVEHPLGVVGPLLQHHALTLVLNSTRLVGVIRPICFKTYLEPHGNQNHLDKDVEHHGGSLDELGEQRSDHKVSIVVCHRAVGELLLEENVGVGLLHEATDVLRQGWNESVRAMRL